MKPGKAYEAFVYEKLRHFFADGTVTLNDKILGRESGLPREIDVSVRLKCQDIELLYIIQCKDWVTKADINVLGELAAVMSDVGAAKGFLLCSAGFRQSNHNYARTKGIELITIEDIKSDRWHVKAEIPFVYVRKRLRFDLSVELVTTQELVDLNRDREVTLTVSMATPLRSGSEPPTTIEQFIEPLVPSAREGQPLDLPSSGIELYLTGLWLPCRVFSITFTTERSTFLKYLTPIEYSQIRNHVTGMVLPLKVKLADIPFRLDSTFTELPGNEVPFYPGLWIEVQEADLVISRQQDRAG